MSKWYVVFEDDQNFTVEAANEDDAYTAAAREWFYIEHDNTDPRDLGCATCEYSEEGFQDAREQDMICPLNSIRKLAD